MRMGASELAIARRFQSCRASDSVTFTSSMMLSEDDGCLAAPRELITVTFLSPALRCFARCDCHMSLCDDEFRVTNVSVKR